MIKDNMDKKYGVGWFVGGVGVWRRWLVSRPRRRRHVVIGEGFGFEVTHEAKHSLYMYFGGYLAILIWKCY